MWFNKQKNACHKDALAMNVNDADFAKVQGGKQVAVLRLHATVPEKVSVIPTANGFTVESNVANATVSTNQSNDGTTVTVMGS